jgi:glycosyltransferase involved in cell wall biosynthesis
MACADFDWLGMKKLVYIVNNRIPAERAYSIQIMHMCMEFSKICNKSNWQFELLAPKRDNPLGRDPFKYHGFPESFKIVWLWCFDAIGKFVALGSFAYWINSITFLLSLFSWRIRERGEFIIFTREIFIALFFSKSVLELHTIPDNASWAYKMMLRNQKKIVAITHAMKEDLVSLGCKSENIFVAPDGIDLDRFGVEIDKSVARSGLGIPADKFVVAYTGSFFQHDWKGVDVLLDAAKSLVDHENILFVLVGGHPEELSEMGEYKKYSNVKLVGHTSFDVVRKYLAAADILVLPNKSGSRVSERYTSPLKLFEYMAARRLILASDLPSIREVLDDDSAVFVESSRADLLSLKIQELSKKTVSDFDSMISCAYNHSKAYSVDKRAENIFEVAKNNYTLWGS